MKSVRKAPDYSHTGRWEVLTEKRDGHEESHVFDAVICCSGHYTYPNLPLKDFPGDMFCIYPEKALIKIWLIFKHQPYNIWHLCYVAGIETFEGKYLHSWDYKGPEDMYGKRVVVIGIGNSGGDIAVETSRVAEQVEESFFILLIFFWLEIEKKTPSWVLVNSVFPILQVYMSTRRGAWIIRQVSDNGLPVDMKYNTRFVHILFQLFPINFFNWFGEKKLNAMYDHTMYALKPKHR